MDTLYIASKTSHAWRWRALRERGHRINATWIDEAGEGQSSDYADLAERCVNEAAQADAVLLYCEPGEVLKGALIEVGAALAAGKEVRCVGDCPSISRVFRTHPRWRECASLADALANVMISHAVDWRGDCAAVSVTSNRIGCIYWLGSFYIMIGFGFPLILICMLSYWSESSSRCISRPSSNDMTMRLSLAISHLVTFWFMIS